jgi:pyruvate formate lyase activating enzyme
LERAVRLGQRAGLEYVYVGNAPSHRYENTHCPACGALLVERRGLRLVHNGVVGGRCPRCHRTIAGVGWDWDRGSTAAAE